MPAIRHPKDFVAGLIFLAFGIAAIALSSGYPLGTAARMGPGYFPRILGILLVVLGAALTLRALRLHGSPIPSWKWRPTLVVITSVVPSQRPRDSPIHCVITGEIPGRPSTETMRAS